VTASPVLAFCLVFGLALWLLLRLLAMITSSATGQA
jgi:hypothetical protein